MNGGYYVMVKRALTYYYESNPCGKPYRLAPGSRIINDGAAAFDHVLTERNVITLLTPASSDAIQIADDNI